jgi:hypothetical protein
VSQLKVSAKKMRLDRSESLDQSSLSTPSGLRRGTMDVSDSGDEDVHQKRSLSSV